MPGIFFKESCSTKLATLSGDITHLPLGLFSSLAIFAINLLGAMPAEAVKFNSLNISARIFSAIKVALPLQ